MSAEQERQSLICRAKKQREDIQQYFNDVDHWNDSHTAFSFIDPDPDGKMRAMLHDLDRVIAAEFGVPFRLLHGGGEGHG